METKLTYCIYMMCLFSLCVCTMPTLNINHPNFDIMFTGLKTDDLAPPSKLTPRSFTKLSLSGPSKILDPIDEEDNNWRNARRDQKRHYNSEKVDTAAQNQEGVPNMIDNLGKAQTIVQNSQISPSFESLPPWFGFPKSFFKSSSKSGKPSEKTSLNIQTKNADSEIRDQDRQQKTASLKTMMAENRSGSNAKSHRTNVSEKNPSTEKTSPDTKNDFDLADLLLLEGNFEKTEVSGEDKDKEETDRKTNISTQRSPVQVQQQRNYYSPPKRFRMFSPIYSSGFDILTSSHQGNGPMSNVGQGYGKSHHSDVGGSKNVDLETNEVRVQPKEHSGFNDKGSYVILNNMKHYELNTELPVIRTGIASGSTPILNKLLPVQLPQQIRINSLRPEGPVEMHNIPFMNSYTEPALTMTEISVLPVQGPIHDLSSLLESTNISSQDASSGKKLKLNRRPTKHSSKSSFSQNEPETSSRPQNGHLNQNAKQLFNPNAAALNGNLIIDITHDTSIEEAEKDVKEAKEKKESGMDTESSKASHMKEPCKTKKEKYPVMYQFLENFSGKILETALKYELGLLKTTLTNENSKQSNSSTVLNSEILQ